MLTATHTHNDLFKTGAGSMQTIRQHQSKVVFSALSEFYAPVDAVGFSIKYVLDGIEVYNLNHEQYIVRPGSYLLSNSNKNGHVEIESSKTVKGICISIAPNILTEAVASYRRPDTFFVDEALGIFFTSSHFPEDTYNAAETSLGKTLNQLAVDVQNCKTDASDFTQEFFYLLAEKVIEDQSPVYKQLQNIPSIKPATKREIYKNIKRSKEFIDSSFTSDVQVSTAAQAACMSEYHFYRLFKQIIGITPHQYILQKRLELAQQLLQQQITVTDVSAECGFSDIFSFSKAFKKHFGFPPSQLLKK
jgi:AraC family transcriptional regulator